MVIMKGTQQRNRLVSRVDEGSDDNELVLSGHTCMRIFSVRVNGVSGWRRLRRRQIMLGELAVSPARALRPA